MTKAGIATAEAIQDTICVADSRGVPTPPRQPSPADADAAADVDRPRRGRRPHHRRVPKIGKGKFKNLPYDFAVPFAPCCGTGTGTRSPPPAPNAPAGLATPPLSTSSSLTPTEGVIVTPPAPSPFIVPGYVDPSHREAFSQPPPPPSQVDESALRRVIRRRAHPPATYTSVRGSVRFRNGLTGLPRSAPESEVRMEWYRGVVREAEEKENGRGVWTARAAASEGEGLGVIWGVGVDGDVEVDWQGNPVWTPYGGASFEQQLEMMDRESGGGLE
ncbi:hypothetical protein B0T16DRAFT_460287 [Cercophora newfieldiana]|uniref:Uncharacterized protein n=1 Tax=Cercophora newfieldiana TaxID=92897 RepID=A0AA40CMA4_9PEZI|nr:hypothetical protein B0T16DRAFT_460287 [Cercophora newfieldiana]